MNPDTHQAFVAVLIIFSTVVVARIAGTIVSGKSAAAARAIGSISLFVNVSQTLVAIVGGLVLLALQDTLANFFAGIQIADDPNGEKIKAVAT